MNPPEGAARSGGAAGGRGSLDTGWEIGRSERSPRFVGMLVASLVVHALFTAGPPLLGLVAMLPALAPDEGEEIVEVDLTALPLGPVAPVPEEPQAPQTPPPEPSTNPAPDVEEEPDSPEPAPAPTPPALPAPSEAPPGPTVEFGDPVALAGSAGKIADSNANVRLFLFNDVVRDHPLGLRVGELLKRTPQWRDFFGPSRIDPVRDIDRVLIAGPQLRNSSQVVAVVQHGLGKERIESAFSNLVERKGEWIDREALLAKARADRADRIFAAPSDKVVVVAPLHLQEQVRGLGSDAAFPPSAKDVAVTAYIVTPANVAKGTGIQLPETIKWARFDIRPQAGGGAILKVLAEDIDAEHATNHALFFQTIIDQAATMDPKRMGGLGAVASMFGVKAKRFIEKVEFKNDGNRILGTIVLTKDQLLLAADLLEGFLPPASKDDDGASARPAPDERGRDEVNSGTRDRTETLSAPPAQPVPGPPPAPAPTSPPSGTAPEGP